MGVIETLMDASPMYPAQAMAASKTAKARSLDSPKSRNRTNHAADLTVALT